MTDFYTKITDQDNEVVKQNFKTGKLVDGKLKETNVYREVTLEDIARNALLKSDDEVNPDEVLKRYQLFRKIYQKGEVDLTENEKTLLKKLICKIHDVIFAGQALEIIK
jgi:hypothetical protein